MGQERFAYFCLGRHSGFSKVSRRQGGTLSGRYRSNGYVHNPAVLTVRALSQASQLPHLDRGASVRTASAIRSSREQALSPQVQRRHSCVDTYGHRRQATHSPCLFSRGWRQPCFKFSHLRLQALQPRTCAGQYHHLAVKLFPADQVELAETAL